MCCTASDSWAHLRICGARFDLIVVTRYLQRDLFPSLRAAVRPGGCIVYETFTVHQRALGTGPTSSDHLLEPGELLRVVAGHMRVLAYEDLFVDEPKPAVVQRICAVRAV